MLRGAGIVLHSVRSENVSIRRYAGTVDVTNLPEIARYRFNIDVRFTVDKVFPSDHRDQRKTVDRSTFRGSDEKKRENQGECPI